MAAPLEGQKIAFVATDGVEQVELTEPWRAVEDAGGTPVLVSPSAAARVTTDSDDHANEPRRRCRGSFAVGGGHAVAVLHSRLGLYW